MTEKFIDPHFNGLPVARPTKIYVLGVRIRQLIYKHQTSYPHISSDTFKDISDATYPYSREEISEEFIQTLIQSNVIFCPSHLLAEMLSQFGNQITARVLICSNSDFEFHKPIQNLPKSVKLVLLENSFISDNSLIFTIPIGVENLRIGMNGMPSLFRAFTGIRENKVLFGPFSPTHPLRGEVIPDFLRESGPWRVINRRLNPRRYARISRKFRFIACVRGNSVESHRIWESLYRGCIPIVQKDAWSESLRYLSLPIEYIENWDIRQIQDVVNSSEIPAFDPAKLAALWMPYWEQLINERLES